MTKKSSEIKISCTSCGSIYRIPDSILGKIVTCKQCNRKFTTEPVAPQKKYPLLGRIALENRLVKEVDLIKALSIQKAVEQRTGKDFPLEDVLSKKGCFHTIRKISHP
jgi:hypothetical protein